ncbi:methylisocitrate lyase [Trichoderma arundinaceum]|uniref:Methylisocitrate lyase n=1 Tax=Trichoderma arundinaceum TaxID=490622 RepID=A0A395NKJ3_TRIAR|nr:methylisocitrate lyase [Trichoderma arundinaceum]
MSNQAKQQTAVASLRTQLAEPGKIIACPGVYDGFTARMALKAGFDCLYMTGAGTTMSRLGMPDLGIATLNDMRETASMIASLDQSVPLIADADTGYGGPVMVGRTVAQYMQAGVAALHLEDQVQSKRCGHLLNKQIVSGDEFLSRIRAAALVREQRVGDILIIARTDALQSEGYEVARDRLKAAIAAGADIAFLEGITSKDQARQICEDLAPTPVLYNNVPGGVSPDLSVQEAKELGFKLIIYPGLSLQPVFEAVTKAMNALKKDGTPPKPEANSNGSPKALFEVVGLHECIGLDKAAGGAAYNGGV